MQYDKEIVEDILMKVAKSVNIIESRSLKYHCGEDFLSTDESVAILDSICMQFIAIGESLKGLDKVTKGELLSTHPEIDWKNIKGLRDIIAHHYFDIDSDAIWWIISHELPALKKAISELLKDVRENN